MNRKRIDMQWLIVSLIGSVLINVIMLPMFAVTAGPQDSGDSLPPRGTPEATPAKAAPTAAPEPTAEKSSKIEGARLQLQIKYGDAWLWDSMSWQDLWTVVEWTDGENWHVVDGWRGTLDGVAQEESGDWISWKEWWISPKDINTGPFRWVIYRQEGGEKLATSQPFKLPVHPGGITVVNQAIGD